MFTWALFIHYDPYTLSPNVHPFLRVASVWWSEFVGCFIRHHDYFKIYAQNLIITSQHALISSNNACKFRISNCEEASHVFNIQLITLIMNLCGSAANVNPESLKSGSFVYYPLMFHLSRGVSVYVHAWLIGSKMDGEKALKVQFMVLGETCLALDQEMALGHSIRTLIFDNEYGEVVKCDILKLHESLVWFSLFVMCRHVKSKFSLNTIVEL